MTAEQMVRNILSRAIDEGLVNRVGCDDPQKAPGCKLVATTDLMIEYLRQAKLEPAIGVEVLNKDRIGGPR